MSNDKALRFQAMWEAARPTRIQRKRTKGWRMPAGAIYVGRPTKFGNPFVAGETASVRTKFGDASVPLVITPELAVDAYRVIAADRGREDFYPLGHGDRIALRWRNAIAHLAGHDLACWCPLDRPCHADVLLELANPIPSPAQPGAAMTTDTTAEMDEERTAS